jgi:hypothetical protein
MYIRPGTVSSSGFWKLMFAAVILFGAAIAIWYPYQDYSFAPGTSYTSAQFVKITGQRSGGQNYGTPQTVYLEQYRYIVNGKTYYLVQNDKEDTQVGPAYDKTVRLVYKTQNPTNARIIYANTLQDDARSNIMNGIYIAVGGSILLGLVFLITRWRARRRNRVEQVSPAEQTISSDAENAVKELQAREAQSDKPSV